MTEDACQLAAGDGGAVAVLVRLHDAGKVDEIGQVALVAREDRHVGREPTRATHRVDIGGQGRKAVGAAVDTVGAVEGVGPKAEQGLAVVNAAGVHGAEHTAQVPVGDVVLVAGCGVTVDDGEAGADGEAAGDARPDEREGRHDAVSGGILVDEDHHVHRRSGERDLVSAHAGLGERGGVVAGAAAALVGDGVQGAHRHFDGLGVNRDAGEQPEDAFGVVLAHLPHGRGQ